MRWPDLCAKAWRGLAWLGQRLPAPAAVPALEVVPAVRIAEPAALVAPVAAASVAPAPSAAGAASAVVAAAVARAGYPQAAAVEPDQHFSGAAKQVQVCSPRQDR